jgi:hypothetical protein
MVDAVSSFATVERNRFLVVGRFRKAIRWSLVGYRLTKPVVEAVLSFATVEQNRFVVVARVCENERWKSLKKNAGYFMYSGLLYLGWVKNQGKRREGAKPLLFNQMYNTNHSGDYD